MSDFTLSRKVENILVKTLKSSDGMEYPIDASFRNVLACLRVLSDPDRSELDKSLFLSVRFFLKHPPADMQELFSGFVNGEDSGAESEEPLLDFEIDAAAIYASFRQQYGIDLLHDDLHWVEFRTLLAGLTENTVFGNRVKIRATDESDMDEKTRSKFHKVKDMVAIKQKESQREKELRAELNRRLEAGENPVEVLNALKEV